MERGLPFMFLTLTVNPAFGINKEQRARRLLAAWRKWVREQRKKYGKHTVEYYYVFEDQQSGEPHLHIVGRWPRIEKEEISAWFEKEIRAPSTRIEGIKAAKDLCKYLTQYLTKGPTRFGTLKRYGYSRKYFIKARPQPHMDPAWQGRWETVDRPWLDLYHEYFMKGFRLAGWGKMGFAEMARPGPRPPPEPIYGKTFLHGTSSAWVAP